MTLNKYNNSLIRLEDGIYILTTEIGDIKQRLIAASRAFIQLKKEAFPDYLQEEFEWIKEQLTKKDAYRNSDKEVLRDQVPVSLYKRRKEKLQEIVKCIIRLRDRIHIHIYGNL